MCFSLYCRRLLQWPPWRPGPGARRGLGEESAERGPSLPGVGWRCWCWWVRWGSHWSGARTSVHIRKYFITVTHRCNRLVVWNDFRPKAGGRVIWSTYAENSLALSHCCGPIKASYHNKKTQCVRKLAAFPQSFFSQNKIDVSKVLTRYDCNMQVFPLNSVKLYMS